MEPEQEPPPAKKIVLFSDGTGNSSGKLFKTNVWRLYQALDLSIPKPTDQKTIQQIAYYDDGVGTSSFKPFALLGGAFGWGLKRNVIDLYTFLCWNYNTGDQIYCFGFSRGAFTIRVLTGLIQSQGLVQADSQRKLKRLATHAFRAYRREHYKTNLGLERPGRALRDGVVKVACHVGGLDPSPSSEKVEKPRIAFLGLWDTVAAYGLPIEELTRAWNAVFPLSRQNKDPEEIVERACHALALDDERDSFHPQLWNERGLKPDHAKTTHLKSERISQVWFAGMHSNVGGGYPDDSLAYVSLNWMIGEAQRAGLSFQEEECDRIKAKANPLGKLYNSRQGLGGSYRYLPRKLNLLTNNVGDMKSPPVIIERLKIHQSVIERIKARVDGYAPFVLPEKYAVVTESGDILDMTEPEKDRLGLLEHPTQAESRTNSQEEVWNIVWWKRVFYFTSIFVVVALITFPLYRSATVACEGPLCGLAPVVSGIGMLLPGLASPWLEAFKSHPGTFSILALLLAVLVYIGGGLQNKIKDKMRTFWIPFIEKHNAPETRAPLPSDVIYRLRSHTVYQTFFRLMKQYILPFVVGVIALLIVVEGVSQGVFSMLSSAGLVCSKTSEKALPEHLVGGVFRGESACWASGVGLKEGKRYRITLTINDKEEDGKKEDWKDKSTSSGLGGFTWKKMKYAHYVAFLLRRHIGEDWFKPIARIGETGSDEYPLEPKDQSIPDQDTKHLVAEITARRNGELFLFVNDAILPVSSKWQYFYGNNTGSVTVDVQPIRELVAIELTTPQQVAKHEP